MIGRPLPSEAAPYFSKYLDLVPGDDPLPVLASQLDEYLSLFAGMTEEGSRLRYETGKWSIRELLSHTTDTERAFAFRALWFGRGFDAPMPSFDQNVAAAGAEADRISWAAHVEDFRNVRQATLSLLRNMPDAAWSRTGIASGHAVTVRALAFLIAGHAAHHIAILRQRYGVG